MQEKGKTVLCPDVPSREPGFPLLEGEGARRRRHVPGNRAVVRRLLLHARLKLGPDRVAKLEKDAGLGTITGIDLPGSGRGSSGHGVEAHRGQGRWYDTRA